MCEKFTSIKRQPSFIVESPLIIEKGTFTWGDEETVLKNVSVEVDKASLVAVVGGVGSGQLNFFVAVIVNLN